MQCSKWKQRHWSNEPLALQALYRILNNLLHGNELQTQIDQFLGCIFCSQQSWLGIPRQSLQKKDIVSLNKVCIIWSQAALQCPNIFFKGNLQLPLWFTSLISKPSLVQKIPKHFTVIYFILTNKPQLGCPFFFFPFLWILMRISHITSLWAEKVDGATKFLTLSRVKGTRCRRMRKRKQRF